MRVLIPKNTPFPYQAPILQFVPKTINQTNVNIKVLKGGEMNEDAKNCERVGKRDFIIDIP